MPRTTPHILKRISGFIRDPRYFQIIFLSSFLTYGVFALGWDGNMSHYLTLIATCLFVQFLGILFLKLPIHSLRSALITSLGLCLLFKAGEIPYFILAGVLAIGSKFLIRHKNKHIFNPANFGVMVPLLISDKTWISPGQWGSDLALLFFFGAAGLMILLRISRLETGLTFLLTYFCISIGYDLLYLGWDLDFVLHKMTNGALLLFAFFMITDPMTIPNRRAIRIIWAASIGVLTFTIGKSFAIHTAAMWVLLAGAPLVPVLDRLFPSKKYQWFPDRGDQEIVNKTQSKQPLKLQHT